MERYRPISRRLDGSRERRSEQGRKKRVDGKVREATERGENTRRRNREIHRPLRGRRDFDGEFLLGEICVRSAALLLGLFSFLEYHPTGSEILRLGSRAEAWQRESE